MRLSCNGCRVLRKGCTDACTIRPCLQWIKTPDAQANATVFLAKFYGRAGLLNLLAASPTPEQRTAVFRSLLYEACGRVVNPVYGAVGLLWSGTWAMCQAAVEAVLKGEPIVQLDPQDQAAQPPPQMNHPQLYDIRHVKKTAAAAPAPDAAVDDHAAQPLQTNTLIHNHKVAKPGRTRFKRTASTASSSSSSKKTKKAAALPEELHTDDDHHMLPVPAVVNEKPDEDQHQHQPDAAVSPSPSPSQCHHASSDDDSTHQNHYQASHDTDAEAGSHVTTVAPEDDDDKEDDHEQQQQQLRLDLTLGFGLLSAPIIQRDKQLSTRRRPSTEGVARTTGLSSAFASSRGGTSCCSSNSDHLIRFI